MGSHVEGGNVGQAPCRIQLSSSIYVVYRDGGWGENKMLECRADGKIRMQERSDERNTEESLRSYRRPPTVSSDSDSLLLSPCCTYSQCAPARPQLRLVGHGTAETIPWVLLHRAVIRGKGRLLPCRVSGNLRIMQPESCLG